MPSIEETKAVHAAVSALGMTPVGPGVVPPPDHIPVLLDGAQTFTPCVIFIIAHEFRFLNGSVLCLICSVGVVLGSFSVQMAAQAAVQLRHKKVTEDTLSKYLGTR